MDKKQSHSTEIGIQEENNHEKDLQGLANTIDKKIGKGAKNTESYFSTACIYRVPEELRKLKESAYTPRLIAIGPLHQDDEHLQTPMQDVKMSYANHLLCRLTENIKYPKIAEGERASSLRQCVAAMQKSIGEAKKCYAEEVKVDAEMMLIDGCFILELFYSFYLGVLDYLKRLHKEATNGGDHGGSSNVSKLGASTSTLNTPLLQDASIGINRMAKAPVAMASSSTRPMASSSTRPKIPDPIVDSSWTWINVQHDLLLLENQIPYFVLERLFPLTVGRITDKISLIDLVDLYFCNMMSQEGEEDKYYHILHGSPTDCVIRIRGNKTANGEKEEKKYYHILHKIHEYCLPCDEEEKKEEEKEREEKKQNEPSEKEREKEEEEEEKEKEKKQKELSEKENEEKKNNKRGEFMPPASELDFAGIKFVGAKAKGKDILKVTFHEPEWWIQLPSFEIPTLGIYDPTEPFLRNLIALEQLVPRVSQHFTSYAFLMDMLVNSEKDIDVLIKAGVLRNYLGRSKDATDLFNNLCKEVVLRKFFFDEMCSKATEYSGYFWPKNLAYVKRTYFASPWTFIAFVVGFIVFVISVTSFVLSLL